MREIMFRAQGTSGEWIYGVPLEGVFDKGLIPFFDYNTGTICRVCAPTVCEFIGVYDNNNRPIFENDFVKTKKYSNKANVSTKGYKEVRYLGLVCYNCRLLDGGYNEKTGKFDKKCPNRAEYEVKLLVNNEQLYKFGHTAWGDFYDCEVIGNVFDNADLPNKQSVFPA